MSSIQHMEADHHQEELLLRHHQAAAASVVVLDDERHHQQRRNQEVEYYYWPPISGAGGEEEEAEGVSMLNKLISTVYSGPTISDIESALSFTGGGHGQLADAADDDSSATPADPHRPAPPRKYDNPAPAIAVRADPGEKVLLLSKTMENKYTLRMKTSSGSGGLAEDGYKWRKYGQKSIKNSPNPRSYYRCTNPRCSAKKQVERATDEADTLLVTYEGLHLHYTYSHFLHSQAQAQAQSTKKPKLQPRVVGPAQDITSSPLLLRFRSNGGGSCLFQQQQEAAAAAAAADHEDDGCYYYYNGGGGEIHQLQQELEQQPMTTTNGGGGGLLEDVVRPLLARRRRPPLLCSRTSTSSSTTATSSPPTAPSPSLASTSSSSVVSWNNNNNNPTSPYYSMDMMAILSNIF